jgi:uncharacterized protein
MKKQYILLLTAFVCVIAGCRPNDTKTHDVIAQLSQPVIDTTGIAQLSAKGWVNDFEDIFTVGEEHSLDSIITNFEKETSIEIAIVTLDTNHVGEDITDMYEATFAIANNWGVGKKDKDNGVVIGISKGRMLMYIQNGKGIENILTDEATQQIIDKTFVPFFSKGDYYDGTVAGLKTIMAVLKISKPTK